MDKKKWIKLLSGLAAVMLCGIFYFLSGAGNTLDTGTPEEGFLETDKEDRPVQKEGEAVYIHVCGEVKKPGVYVFSAPPRASEAVERAGGFTKKADTDCINQAETVSDGTQLKIPPRAGKAAGKGKKQVLPDKDRTDKVNINTASKEELMTLSGIGESKASQILSYREEAGAFRAIEDIMKISGIKEGVFGKIKDKITV